MIMATLSVGSKAHMPVYDYSGIVVILDAAWGRMSS